MKGVFLAWTVAFPSICPSHLPVVVHLETSLLYPGQNPSIDRAVVDKLMVDFGSIEKILSRQFMPYLSTKLLDVSKLVNALMAKVYQRRVIAQLTSAIM